VAEYEVDVESCLSTTESSAEFSLLFDSNDGEGKASCTFVGVVASIGVGDEMLISLSRSVAFTGSSSVFSFSLQIIRD